MNAICRTPKTYREQLLKFVHRPVMEAIIYPDCSESSPPSLAHKSLQDVYSHLDIEDDPFVKYLRSLGETESSRSLRKALVNKATSCQDQMRTLVRMASSLHLELGSWAADFYIRSCLSKVHDRNVGPASSDEVSVNEMHYLKRILSQVPRPPIETDFTKNDPRITPKVHHLLEAVKSEMSPEFAGLVFTQTRASVVVLAKLLSCHPETKDIVRVGTFVGTSNYGSKRSKITELLDIKEQPQTLDDLRNRKKNLVISTSILEEGIDISACNVVICFESPPNLKSFIQRRGRARQSKSKYIIMFEQERGREIMSKWQKLEDEMKEIYMNDMRKLSELEIEETSEEYSMDFTIQSTGSVKGHPIKSSILH